MSEELVKKRISVTLTEPYIEGLNKLVETGLYLNRGEIILKALRILLGRHGIEPFTSKGSGLKRARLTSSM